VNGAGYEGERHLEKGTLEIWGRGSILRLETVFSG
jgi:hypothetical protein